MRIVIANRKYFPSEGKWRIGSRPARARRRAKRKLLGRASSGQTTPKQPFPRSAKGILSRRRPGVEPNPAPGQRRRGDCGKAIGRCSGVVKANRTNHQPEHLAAGSAPRPSSWGLFLLRSAPEQHIIPVSAGMSRDGAGLRSAIVPLRELRPVQRPSSADHDFRYVAAPGIDATRNEAVM